MSAEGYRNYARYAQANDACEANQYRLYAVGEKVYGPVQLLWRYRDEIHDEAPAGYHRWYVKFVASGAQVFVLTSNLGKQLSEMEVLAWAARD